MTEFDTWLIDEYKPTARGQRKLRNDIIQRWEEGHDREVFTRTQLLKIGHRIDRIGGKSTCSKIWTAFSLYRSRHLAKVQ